MPQFPSSETHTTLRVSGSRDPSDTVFSTKGSVRGGPGSTDRRALQSTCPGTRSPLTAATAPASGPSTFQTIWRG
eukprot:3878989-Rhodomonas_salina.1